MPCLEPYGHAGIFNDGSATRARRCTTRSRAAPIDHEMRTSDVTRQIRTQIHHHIRYFFRRRIAPRRRTCAVRIMDDPWIRGVPRGPDASEPVVVAPFASPEPFRLWSAMAG